jgi:streptogramin lyase
MSRRHARSRQLSGSSAGAFALAACLLTVSCVGVAEAGAFKHLATFRGIGAVLRSLVGPGPTPGSERIYQSHVYIGGSLEIVSFDPDTGEHTVFPSPLPSESGAWGMVLGPDGSIYVGTLPNAHLLRLEPRSGKFTDLGRPSGTEQYIWGLSVGSDNRIYGSTYPSAKLVRYDPVGGAMEDLGRMDLTEQYGRHVAADNNGFVYIGIGSGRTGIVAYEIATGAHRDILPAQYRAPGFATVYQGADGGAYGWIAGQHFRLRGWNLTPVAGADAAMRRYDQMRDGRFVVQVGQGLIRVQDPKTRHQAELPYRYEGKEIEVFRLTMGPDGKLYGSSVLPMHFFSVHPHTGEVGRIGLLGPGEFYSLLPYKGYVLGAAYSADAPLMVYDPSRRFLPGDHGASSNPMLVKFAGQDIEWRPMAMILGPGGGVYIGAVSGYGRLGGHFTIWDPETHNVRTYQQVVTDQSIASLAVAGDQIVGGTTVAGGGGSRPTQAEAKLFIWDTIANRKVYEVVPVPGAREISDLVIGPDRRIYGVADGSVLFAFDPTRRSIVRSMPLPFQGAVYNSAAFAADGRLWGLAKQGIFVFDPRTNAARLVATSPDPITGGFAMDERALYFASGSKVYRFEIPALDQSTDRSVQ